MATTLYDKLWAIHHAGDLPNGEALIYIDLHLIHEVTSPQAFSGLKLAGRKVRRPDLTFAVADHNTPTENQSQGLEGVKDAQARLQLQTLENNVAEYGVRFLPMGHQHNGIVHVVGPEQGLTQPGMTIVCGDSHTSTHGAFGSLAHGIGTSEVEHVMATQTLRAKKMQNMAVNFHGTLAPNVTAKDMALHLITKIGTAGGTGCVMEYRGEAVENLSMEGRMTLCNLSIEGGARAGIVAPDQTTFDYVKGRKYAPQGDDWERKHAKWLALKSDDGAHWDKIIDIDCADIKPTISWGTSPEQCIPVDQTIPMVEAFETPTQRKAAERALNYMGFKGGEKLADIRIDRVFIGSCTNSRIEDLRAAADIFKGQKVAAHIRALIVPGSGLVKAQAEAEGLDGVFRDAGCEWREPGCSMCLGMNPDILAPNERCASTSNRNFEGRQGRMGRTHLLSPQLAAKAAISGVLFAQ